jgi:acetoin utilization deacetylase AcuC-like enzyme
MRAIPVFYTEKILADSGSYSPSAAKPTFVVEAWRRAALPIDWRTVTPATVEDLSLAHHPEFVSSILAGTARNGFGNHRPDVAQSLPFTTGAMLNAAVAALECGIACAPVSGFHHAGYSTATMFCTFNGLMITALKLLRSKQVKRILLLDLDQHYGNGADEIKKTLGIGKEIVNATFGRWYDNPSQASEYLVRLKLAIKQFPKFDLVLYQAGADLHVDDPLGGVLDSNQMRERDSIVFDAARSSGVPLVWNLAGGYQDSISKVVRIHMTTMEECVRTYVMNCSTDTTSPYGCRVGLRSDTTS